MTVWIIVHEDNYGGAHVRAVCATEAQAKQLRVDRAPSGARSRAFYAHDEDCCDIEEWEVQT